MFKLISFFVLIAVACVLAAPKSKPGIVAAAYAAAPVAPAIVTAQSSQVVARNYNAFAAPLVAAAPVAVAPAAPIVAPQAIAAAPYFAAPAFSAPYVL